MRTDSSSVKQVIDFAISDDEYKQFGCPVCGYAYSTITFAGGGGYEVICKNELCKSAFFILLSGLEEFEGVSLRTHDHKNSGIKLKDHPRKSIPALGKRQDKKPPKGEFLKDPKDSTYDHGLCFICRTACRLPVDVEWPMKRLFSIAMETSSIEAAKRVDKMFREKDLFINWVSRDGWEFPFDFYCLNISSCYDHRPNLLKLREISEKEGIVTEEVLCEIKAPQK